MSYIYLSPALCKKMLMTTPGPIQYLRWPNSIPLVPPSSRISVIKHCTVSPRLNSGAALLFAWIYGLSYFSFLFQFA